MKSGSQPHKPACSTLTFADAVAVARTPEEQKARQRAEARNRKNRQKGPEEGKVCKQDEFILMPTFDAICRELTFLAAATIREIGKQEIESPTKAADNMPLPLAQNMGKIIGRSSKQFRTELVKGLGNTHGFEMHIMARKEPNGNWLVRVLHHNVSYSTMTCLNSRTSLV